jgi:L-iditol 2-dehydrogenase
MNVARFYGPHDIRVETAPDRAPGPGEVTIKPLAVGVCGTDSHILDGEFPAVAGTVLGHEVAGEITSLGAGVNYLAVGDLVTIEPHIYCGRCHYCRKGAEHLCLDKKAFGVHLDGGFATGLVVPARIAYKVPPNVPATEAAFSEPLACCVHAVDRLAVFPGDSVLIIGAGPAGLLLTKVIRLRGAGAIVVSELDEERRNLALAFGADFAIDPRDESSRQIMNDVTAGLGFAKVVDAVGGAPTLQFGLAAAARRGVILVFGVARPDAAVSVRPFEVFQKELSIVGTAINPYTHESSVTLLARMELHRMPIRRFKLSQIREALAYQKSGRGGKAMIFPQEQ